MTPQSGGYIVWNVQEYLKLRTAHVNALKAIGESPYPHKFLVTISLSDFIDKYSDINDGEQHADVVSVAGHFSHYFILFYLFFIIVHDRV